MADDAEEALEPADVNIDELQCLHGELLLDPVGALDGRAAWRGAKT